MTGSQDIRTDLCNAGAEVVKYEAVVVDTGSIYVGESAGVIAMNFKIVSSRNSNDLAFFCRAIADYL